MCEDGSLSFIGPTHFKLKRGSLKLGKAMEEVDFGVLTHRLRKVDIGKFFGVEEIKYQHYGIQNTHDDAFTAFYGNGRTFVIHFGNRITIRHPSMRGEPSLQVAGSKDYPLTKENITKVLQQAYGVRRDEDDRRILVDCNDNFYYKQMLDKLLERFFQD